MVLGLASCSDDRDARRPADWNVVLVTLDTVRADALGAYGQARPTTPVLDRIAREGVVFTDVTSAAPHTVASHASIMTGLYPFAHGARANHGFPLAAEHTTLAEILASAGHRTRAEIAAPVLHASTRIAQGFESEAQSAAATDGETPVARAPGGGLRRSAENVTARALETLEGLRDEPFFLWLHYFDAHLPYVDRPADRAAFPEAPYLAQVHALDRSLGLVFDALEAKGLRDHTLVVVTSDHGEGLGEHEEPTHSYFVYDSTMRVPLLLWGPDALPSGLRLDAPARTVDILPTLAKLAGAPLPPHTIDGKDIWPLLSGQAGAKSPHEYYAMYYGRELQAVRSGEWKLHFPHGYRSLKGEPGKDGLPGPYVQKRTGLELYNLKADISESENIAADHPDVVARLQKYGEEIRTELGDSRTRTAGQGVRAVGQLNN